MNPATILVLVLFAGLLALAIRSIVKRRKNGGACASCSSGATCPHCGDCPSQENGAGK